MFDSKEFRKFLQFIKDEYNFVIFDLPSMQEDNSAVKLGHLVDGVLFVVEAERMRWQVIQQTQQQLTNANVNILGVILNKRKHHIPKWIYDNI